ncbi:MAG: hypothetical protein ABIF45_17590 [Pseudomonadota bacterium]
MNHPFQPSVYRRSHAMLISSTLVGAILAGIVVSTASILGVF